jgi:hypothetical protein
MGSFWEFKRNMLGIKEKMKKSSPHPKLKRKKSTHAEPSKGCMKFLFPKLFITIFGLG